VHNYIINDAVSNFLNAVVSESDRASQQTCSQSAVGGVSTHEGGRRVCEQWGDLKKV